MICDVNLVLCVCGLQVSCISHYSTGHEIYTLSIAVINTRIRSKVFKDALAV